MLKTLLASYVVFRWLGPMTSIPLLAGIPFLFLLALLGVVFYINQLKSGIFWLKVLLSGGLHLADFVMLPICWAIFLFAFAFGGFFFEKLSPGILYSSATATVVDYITLILFAAQSLFAISNLEEGKENYEELEDEN